MESSTRTLYHYTSEKAAEEIRKSKIIKSSKKKGGHAHFGDGVYFTDMSPQDFEKTEVSTNNYQYPNAKKKLEYCITVTMPRNKVKECLAKNKRRVFLHEGDLKLEGKVYKIEKSKFKEHQTTQNPSVVQQGGATKTGNDIGVEAPSCALHIWLLSQ